MTNLNVLILCKENWEVPENGIGCGSADGAGNYYGDGYGCGFGDGDRYLYSRYNGSGYGDGLNGLDINNNGAGVEGARMNDQP